MVLGFTRSEEGLNEYLKLGIAYPDNFDDERYEGWLSTTSADNLSQYIHHKEKEITAIRIYQVNSAEYDDDGSKNRLV